jgi:hypothetical protein
MNNLLTNPSNPYTFTTLVKAFFLTNLKGIPMKPLICVDCKWSIATPASVAGTYYCKASEVINLVTGAPEYRFCSVMRLAHEPCGLDGKLFELNISEETVDGI